MHTQIDTPKVITSRGADYVMTVKANTDAVQEAQEPFVGRHPRRLIREHGPRPTRARRTIKVALAPSWIGFEGAAQVAQLRRTVVKNDKKTVEVVYLITSDLDASPATLAARARGHWHIASRTGGPHRYPIRLPSGPATVDHRGMRPWEMAAGTSAETDPADLGLVAAAALLHDRTLSARELLAACARRIGETNGGEPSFDGGPAAVNAWARLYLDDAWHQACAADERRAGDASSVPPLCGVPVALKDLYLVRGLAVTASSRVLDGHIAERDSVAWERLRDNGMVLVGHTHTHEFAAGGTADQVGNPWALDRSAGGSSAGSAAALACGMVPAALGTDTCGSLRIPASLSGVSAIKPTHGRIPTGGVLPLAPSLDHCGPMARSLADCAALLTVLAAGGAERTPLMPPPAPLGELPQRAGASDRPLAGLTVALTDRPEAVGVEPDVADGLDRARRACVELGATVVEIPAAADLSGGEFNDIMLPEVAFGHAGYAGAEHAYRPGIREFVQQSRRHAAVGDYLEGQRRRARITAGWEDWFATHAVDVLLEPTCATTAPVRGTGYEPGHAAGPGDPLIRFTATWNATGFPVAALPAGLGARTGLPVGVSLVGTRGNEYQVLQVAIELQERALPPLGITRPRPGHAPSATDGPGPSITPPG